MLGDKRNVEIIYFQIIPPNVREYEGKMIRTEEKQEIALILVVEDEEEVRKMIAEHLRRFGYEVKVAANPDEALAFAFRGEGCPDLIVTDVRMPRMTGTQMVMQMRAQWPNLRVVFISGFTEDPLLETEFSTAPILYKPFELDTLVETMHSVL